MPHLSPGFAFKLVADEQEQILFDASWENVGPWGTDESELEFTGEGLTFDPQRVSLKDSFPNQESGVVRVIGTRQGLGPVIPVMKINQDGKTTGEITPHQFKIG